MRGLTVGDTSIIVVSSLLLLTLIISACGSAESTSVTRSPTATLIPLSPRTPRPPSPTLPPCFINPSLPPVCGIIPGQTTEEDLEANLGVPWRTTVLHQGWTLPGGVPGESFWFYDYRDGTLEVFLDNGVVRQVRYLVLDSGVSLSDAVQMYGPPEKVQFIIVDYSEGEDLIAFIWPAQGLVMEMCPGATTPPAPELAAFIAQFPDPEEVPPPFEADLPIWYIWHFEPMELEEVVSTYHDGGVLLDWSGLEE